MFIFAVKYPNQKKTTKGQIMIYKKYTKV